MTKFELADSVRESMLELLLDKVLLSSADIRQLMKDADEARKSLNLVMKRLSVLEKPKGSFVIPILSNSLYEGQDVLNNGRWVDTGDKFESISTLFNKLYTLVVDERETLFLKRKYDDPAYGVVKVVTSPIIGTLAISESKKQIKFYGIYGVETKVEDFVTGDEKLRIPVLRGTKDEFRISPYFSASTMCLDKSVVQVRDAVEYTDSDTSFAVEFVQSLLSIWTENL